MPVLVASPELSTKLLATIQPMNGKGIKEKKIPAGQWHAGSPLRFSVNLQPGKVTARNVIGFIEAQDSARIDEYIVVGAHYDHMGVEVKRGDTLVMNGADDNASGTAALLELAAHLASGDDKPACRVIFIAFDAEEQGLKGSYLFTQENEDILDNTRLMINLDMVGRLNHKNKLTVFGANSWEGGVDVVQAHAPLYHFKTKHKKKLPVMYSSDHYHFNRASVPHVFFYTGKHRDVHKHTDTADKINVEGISLVVGLSADVLLQVDRLEEVKHVPVKQGGLSRAMVPAMVEMAKTHVMFYQVPARAK